MALSSSVISAATKAIQDNQRLLIVPHANVDPDGLSSALACYQLFSALGKEVTVVCPDTKPEMLEFLPGFENLTQDIRGAQQFVITVNLEGGVEVDKLRYTVEDNKVNIIVVPKHGSIQPQHVTLGEGEAPYDLIVAVDTADLALFGSMYTDHVDLFKTVPILNIDHHISNTQYGQVQMIDSTAASATEVLYSWFTQVAEWKDNLTADMATLLLTGLITDTRSFQNPNTTPRSLEIAAELLEKGARQQEIIQHIYKTKPLSTLKIWGRALNRIQMDPNAGIVWSAVSKEDLAEMGATSKETHGILDELISTIPDADVHVLFTELEEGGLKASARSGSGVDISKLAGELFGGGGHPQAAGFRLAQFDNFELAVLDCIAKLKEGMARQQQGEQAATDMTAGQQSAPQAIEQASEQERQQAAQPGEAPSAQQNTPQPAEPQPPREDSGVDVLRELSGDEQKSGQ